ncbi:hypothetical protein KIN20_015634 [Parelaphostrongylus tenuis]|uniref:Uncharacterized protein n=1 Tax=Parelaphostrongylus tenuis TaxID=148309 RepID=A0AAD5QQ21_PARTN|nr:hypothetical protein KIN20_015634 [Parelaphostrongylus tenuis]
MRVLFHFVYNILLLIVHRTHCANKEGIKFTEFKKAVSSCNPLICTPTRLSSKESGLSVIPPLDHSPAATMLDDVDDAPSSKSLLRELLAAPAGYLKFFREGFIIDV